MKDFLNSDAILSLIFRDAFPRAKISHEFHKNFNENIAVCLDLFFFKMFQDEFNEQLEMFMFVEVFQNASCTYDKFYQAFLILEGEIN